MDSVTGVLSFKLILAHWIIIMELDTNWDEMNTIWKEEGLAVWPVVSWQAILMIYVGMIYVGRIGSVRQRSVWFTGFQSRLGKTAA